MNKRINRSIQKNLSFQGIIFLLLLAISGCTQNPQMLSDGIQAANAQEISQKPVIEESLKIARITPTPVIAKSISSSNLSISTVETEPTQFYEPLEFTFPTPAPEPISAWRPPLYPVPWEPTSHDHFYFYRPIGADQVNWPLAKYRYGGVLYKDVVHTGIDIPAPEGTPVLAAGSGKVIWAGYGLYFLSHNLGDPYGLAIAIKHDFGYKGHTLYTVYGHMSELNVYNGQQVSAGDIIGFVGQTGNASGPHLHFEVRIDKNNFFGSRNPELWISPPQGWGILAARIMRTNHDLLYQQKIIIRNKEINKQWSVNTYGRGSVNSDAYYKENMVIGDLPAGEYTILTEYNGSLFKHIVTVKPGLVTYFSFHGKYGFASDIPIEESSEFEPPLVAPQP